MTQKMNTDETPERYPTCGAKTRKGTPCRLRAGYKTSHPGEGRCKFHGGASSGPPEGNKNAVTAGEYELLFFDLLTDAERELYSRMDPEPKAQVKEEIRLLTIRERRMLARIGELVASCEEVGTVETGAQADGIVTVPSEATLEHVQRVEEALTRVQQRKGWFVEILRRIEAAPEEPSKKSGTALTALVQAIKRSDAYHDGKT